jgi:hypothetical protein
VKSLADARSGKYPTIHYVVVCCAKFVATALLTLALVASGLSQQVSQTLAPENAAASAFDRVMKVEAGHLMKRIYKKQVQSLCAADARRWGDGIVGYDRITFMSELDLASKMRALVHQWKTRGAEAPQAFNADEFPKLRRYSMASCGVADSQTKVVIAVYRSA